MAFDPKKEDFDRLFVQHLIDMGAAEPPEPHAFEVFIERFSNHADTLLDSDENRAFHLMSQAVEKIDYLLPGADISEGERLIQDGKRLLKDACSLDPNCFDALRIQQSMSCSMLEESYSYLAELEEEVFRACTEKAAAASQNAPKEFEEAVTELAMRPYHRWLAALASRALIAGRNKAAIAYGQKLFSFDPYDFGNVRFTLALAYAKLEDQHGLVKLQNQYVTVKPARPSDDAWMTLSRIALAFKENDLASASALVSKLLERYATGALTLFVQRNIPEGEYARLNVEPYSEDELILAVSEAAVLLQEGNDFTGRGVFGRWLGTEIQKRYPDFTDDFEEELLHFIHQDLEDNLS